MARIPATLLNTHVATPHFLSNFSSFRPQEVSMDEKNRESSDSNRRIILPSLKELNITLGTYTHFGQPENNKLPPISGKTNIEESGSFPSFFPHPYNPQKVDDYHHRPPAYFPTIRSPTIPSVSTGCSVISSLQENNPKVPTISKIRYPKKLKIDPNTAQNEYDSEKAYENDDEESWNERDSRENSPNYCSTSSPITTNGTGSDTGSMLGEITKQNVIRKPKGLRHVSKKVCEIVEQKKATTYDEVAEELQAEEYAAQMQDNGARDVDKNLRRRVYDALNVQAAVGIIDKGKKGITWIGLPGDLQNGVSSSSSTVNSAESDRRKAAALEEYKELQREHSVLTTLRDESKKKLQTKTAECLLRQNLVNRNAHRCETQINTKCKNDREIFLPFVLLQCQRGNTVEIQPSQTCISFHPNPPSVISDTSVLQKLDIDKITRRTDDEGSYRNRGGNCGTIDNQKNVSLHNRWENYVPSFGSNGNGFLPTEVEK